MAQAPLPNGAGGYQLGDGNLSEVSIGVQTTPAAYTAAAAPLLTSDLTNGIITYTSGSGANLQLPLASDLDSTVSSAKANSSFDFSVIALGAGTATVTTNTGWTLVGSMAVATTVSGTFRARKTAVGSWVLYRLA